VVSTRQVRVGDQSRVADEMSSEARLRAAIERDRRRIEQGERPGYTVRSAPSTFGGIDVTIEELPLVHLFVPDEAGIREGARALIARTLQVDPARFDVRTSRA
jgi:hypothetical protein